MNLINICLIFIAIDSKCEVNVNFSDTMATFLDNYFEDQIYADFNFYGCLSRREQHRFARKQTDQMLLRRVSFIKTVGILRERKIFWLVSSAISCNIVPYLEEINKNNMFQTINKHLIIISDKDLEKYMAYLNTFHILPMSEVIIAIFSADEINLYLIYKIGYKSEIIKEHYGIWSAQNGLRKLVDDKPLSVARSNFRKYPIKLGAVIFKDKNIINSDFDDIPKTTDSFFQQDLPILYSLLQSVNATMEITVYDNYGYGLFNKSTGKINGDGMAVDLFDKNIDLSQSMFLSVERLKLFQPLSPIDIWGFKFFLKKPSLSYVRNIYVLTLSDSVWIATLLVTILFMGTLYITLKWEISTYNKKNTPTGAVHNISVSDMFLLSFEALCQQGTTIESFRIAGRLLLLLQFLLFMFIYVAYSASILVLLKSTANVNSLSELLESRYEVGGLNQPYIKHYFQSPKSGILRELYLKKIHPNSYFNESRGLEKVQEGNFAFFAPIVISYKYFLKNFTNYDICTLQELSGYIYTKSYPCVEKSSGYTEIFKIGLLKLRERGIAQRSKVRVVDKPKCNNQAGNFQPVRIFDCLYVILIYIYGAMLSILVVIVEFVIKRYSHLIIIASH